jgi:hypothetical protein
MSSAFVNTLGIEDKLEYAIVVGQNRYNDVIIYLCSSQREITTKMETELGAWYLYDGIKFLNRIKSPVPTEVFKNKLGEEMIRVSPFII